MSDRMSEPAIRVENLSKRFGAVIAVDRLTFSVARGAVIGLLGGNGAGKTTSIAMLLGLLIPSGGTIRILGEDMLKHRYRVLERMNFSSPYVALPKRLTPRQNLDVYARLYGVPDPVARIAALERELALEDFIDRRTGSLSAGQTTRVLLAKSLLNRPELLLLDEPTASLDPESADWIRRYLEAYRKASGATILLASHNMAEVERLCSEVLMMRKGRIVDRGRPDELVRRYGRTNLEEVFLDIARAGAAVDKTPAGTGEDHPVAGDGG